MQIKFRISKLKLRLRAGNFYLECVKCGAYKLYEPENYILFVRLAAIAQLGERQTEDLKVPGSIPGGGKLFFIFKVFLKTKVKSNCN